MKREMLKELKNFKDDVREKEVIKSKKENLIAFSVSKRLKLIGISDWNRIY